ncbi:aminoglycoside adenylyltransferase domain-containing protein [Falsibacillus albus]|nr:aminoglycoside adenylyltransferase domain-containing protein [Falsibacillus albus]
MQVIPSPIREVLDDYIELIGASLPTRLEGLYVHGSIALGAYVEGKSDIDFIAVTSEPITEKDLPLLSGLHLRIKKMFPSFELDGGYVTWDDLAEDDIYQKSFVYYNDGEMKKGTVINPVTTWFLQKKAVNIIGPGIQELEIGLDDRLLIRYTFENINTYWADRIQFLESQVDRLDQWTTEQIDSELEWSILGMLRQYYTLKEKDIISKVEAGEYALRHLPALWHPIIQEAINIRSGNKEELFGTHDERIQTALKFLRYLHSHFNQLMEVEGRRK